MVKLFFFLIFALAANSFAQASSFSGLGSQLVPDIESVKGLLFSLMEAILNVLAFIFVFFVIYVFFLKDAFNEYKDARMAEKGYVRNDPYKVKYYGTEYVKEIKGRR